jgi:iron complex outermembrane receptor protein
VYQRSASTVYKIVYGRPFRNPSSYEKYMNDGRTLIANPALRAEQAHTFEISAERKMGSALTAIVNVYEYRMQNLLQETLVEGSVAPQFQNLANAHSTGLEFELAAKLPRELEMLGSMAFQRAMDTGGGFSLPNSPRVLTKLRAGIPVASRRLFLASSAEYMTARTTDSSAAVCPVFLQSITLTTRRPLSSGLEVQAGVRNLWNSMYEDPVALTVETMRQNGRSVFLKFSWSGSH